MNDVFVKLSVIVTTSYGTLHFSQGGFAFDGELVELMPIPLS
jgi:hypothetical protein